MVHCVLSKFPVVRRVYRMAPVLTRDGPKFGRRRSSAEEFGRMFGSATVTIRPKFGRTSANIRRHLWLSICCVLRSPLAL